MKRDLLHTPEGVRDIYGNECREKKILSDRLRAVCERYGYSEIQTPTFEFFDVFSDERGSVASNEMFKFFDNHGNTLVLRPDVTPSVARAAAKYFHASLLPVKVYYKGEVFINHENAYRGQLKENTTVGAEIIGYASEYEDFEIICMAIDCMKDAGLTDFQVELGNVMFFKGLMKEAGVDEASEAELISLINNKNLLAVEEFIKELGVDTNIASAINALPGLFGNISVLDKARQLSSNDVCQAAIDRLASLYDRLESIGYDKHVSFDLGSLSTLAYYTGIIFKAYTFGTGDAVLSGGRYDKLLDQFGVDKEAIGFAVTLDRLMDAINRQNIEVQDNVVRTLLVIEEGGEERAYAKASQLRKNSLPVSIIKASSNLTNEDYIKYSDEWKFQVIFKVFKDYELMLRKDGKEIRLKTADGKVTMDK